MLATLRQRNFALLWTAGLVSLLGDWLLLIALPVYVFDLTGSALATGALLIASFCPIVLVGSVAGVFVDRWDRCRTMIVANLLRAPLLLLLLLVRSPESISIVYVVAFLQSMIGQFFGPAENALLPRLVDRSHLLAANTLNTLNDNVARLIGPPAGGALLSFLGLPSVVLLDAASFIIGAALISLMNLPSGSGVSTPVAAQHDQLVSTLWREWQDGMRLIRRQHAVFRLFTVQGIAMIGQGIFNVLWVVFAQDVLVAGAVGFGWLATAQGVGSLIGSLLIGRLAPRASPRRLLALGIGIPGLLALVSINARSLPVSLCLSVVGGIWAMGWLAGGPTILQSEVAEEYHGRVFGAYGTTLALLQLVGMGLSTLLGDRLGTVPLLNVAATIYVLSGLVALAHLPRTSSSPVPHESSATALDPDS